MNASVAHNALDTLLDRNDRLEVAISICARAWANLDHPDRVEIGQRWPRLAEALIQAQNHRAEQ